MERARSGEGRSDGGKDGISRFLPSFPDFGCKSFPISAERLSHAGIPSALHLVCSWGYGGQFVKNNSLLRTPQLFAGARIASIVTMAFGLFVGLKPALAEFEIQEAGIEKGEVELEYRGAYHWGFPEAEGGEG